MPTTVVTLGQLEEGTKRRLAASIAGAFVEVGVPEHLITILFRHIRGEDLALGPGEFPYWPKGSEPAPAVFARAEITGGGFDREKKAGIAARIGEALVMAGVPERFVTIVFRDVNPTDVFSARGVSPF